MNFKLIQGICTDIDGTLLDSNRQLSQRTIAAVRSLQNKIPFILASSRMPAAMVHLQAELGILNTPLICYNGGYVLQYRADDDQPIVFDSVEIALPLVEQMVAMVAGTDIHVSLYNRDNWYAPKQDHWTDREEKVTKVKSTIMALPDVISHWHKTNTGAHKVMCMGPEEHINAMQQTLHRDLGNDLHIYRSRNTYLEIAPQSISKGTALKMIMNNLFNATLDNVIAFGDNYNDIDMLRMAGIGIAVSNARPEVLAVANEVTGKSIEDGVAVAMEKLLK